MNFTQLASRSLRILGVLDPGESIPTQELSGAMEACNSMLKAWAARRTMVYALTQSTFAIPASTVSVTIGPSGDIDTGTPNGVDHVWARANGVDYPLEERDLETFNQWTDKDISGTPEWYALRKNYPLWIMYFRPLPDQAYTLYVEHMQPFTAFSSNTDTVTFPGEYEEALVYNLALRLSPEYTKPMSQEAMGVAISALQTIRNKNSHPVKSICATPFNRSRSYDINSDQ